MRSEERRAIGWFRVSVALERRLGGGIVRNNASKSSQSVAAVITCVALTSFFPLLGGSKKLKHANVLSSSVIQ